MENIHVNQQTTNFNQVYNDYYTLVYGTILNKINNPDFADDLCQEVFIRFYKSLDEVENHRKWLLGTVRNVVFEYYRKKYKDDKLINIEELLNNVNMTYVNAFCDLKIIIQEALDHIENYKDRKDRVLFELIALNDHTYAEAAKYVNMEKYQVRYRYNLISERILKYLQKKGIQSPEDIL